MDSTRLEALERILASEPDDYLTHFLLGREYLTAKRFGDAERVLARCVELKPDYSAAWKQLADAQRLGGDSGKALATYRQGAAVGEQTGDLQVTKECRAFIERLTRP